MEEGVLDFGTCVREECAWFILTPGSGMCSIKRIADLLHPEYTVESWDKLIKKWEGER